MSYPEYIEDRNGRRHYRDNGYGVRTKHQLEPLKKLIKDHIKPHMTGLEVGCHTGISTEAFAKSCKRLYAVDLWSNVQGFEDVFDFRTKNYDNIIKIKGDSDDSHEQFEEGSLDFIYVDGGHKYERVVKDLQNWVPKVRVGGLIMGHDYLKTSPEGYTPEQVAACEVNRAVDNTIGVPEIFYKDNSFVIKKNKF